MAIAAHTVAELRLNTRSAFVAELERLLREQLEDQRTAPCVLVRCREGACGYQNGGEHVWVIGYRSHTVGQEVVWVTGDYQIYTDDVNLFDVEPGWLADRFRSK